MKINKPIMGKKLLAGFLSASILTLSATTVFAENIEPLVTDGVEKTKEILPISSEFMEEKQSYFNCFTGKVIEIKDIEGIDGAKFISVENEEGMPANIIVADDTYIVGNEKINVGSIITGYYKANAPMIMIYPPQYKAEVVVVGEQEENIKIDLFDEDLVSADNFLKLNIVEDTKVVSQDGKIFEGDLFNRKLVVIYDVSTRSIPAQTNPKNIIVLPEEKEELLSEEEEEILFEEETLVIGNVSDMNIVVNDKKIDAPSAYANKDGVVMVPLKAIAKELEIDITWNQEDQSIRVGKGISLKIGEDKYIYMKTPVIQLGTAPELLEGRTFVPLSFFREVVRMNNAYVFEGQIVIDNGEKME